MRDEEKKYIYLAIGYGLIGLLLGKILTVGVNYLINHFISSTTIGAILSLPVAALAPAGAILGLLLALWKYNKKKNDVIGSE